MNNKFTGQGSAFLKTHGREKNIPEVVFKRMF